MKSQRFAVAAFAVVVASASPVDAVPLLSGFGGPSGYGTVDHCVHPTDNGSYAGPNVGADATPVAIDLRPAFPGAFSLFGRTYESFYLNANGNITFAAPLASPNAVAYPVDGQPMIAPWWADVDTRLGGSSSANAVCFHVELNRVVVTWHDVQRHGATDGRVNDFQMILSTSGTCTRGGDLDFEFRYNRCEWAAGEGGQFAQVGLDAGNRMNFVALPESRSAAITRVCETTNVPGGAPGLYRFSIRGSGIRATCAGAGSPCGVPGVLGACAEGVTLCRGWESYCAQVNAPRPPRCNNRDNDCDGRIDDGPASCGDGYACEDGDCRRRCAGDGECPTGQACTARGTCAERACAEVDCPSQQRCRQGACVDACSVVTCPAGAVCRFGQCVDACEGVACEDGNICDRNPRSPTVGWCAPPCQCRPCESGSVCLADGYCVDEGCEGVACPSGTVCRAGECRDACEAAAGVRLCANDQVCRAGACIAMRDGGVVGPDVVDAAVVDGGVRGDRAMVVTGCGCRASGAPAGTSGWWLVGLLMAGGRVGARRRWRGRRVA